MARGPASIATAIGRLLRRNPQWLHAFWLERLKREWDLVPAPFRQGCVPLHYDGEKLQLAVRSHVWKQEIGLRRRELERLIRDTWPQLHFTRLWLRVVPDARLPEPLPSPPDRVPLRRIQPPAPGSPGDVEFGRLYEAARQNPDPMSQALARLVETRMRGGTRRNSPQD